MRHGACQQHHSSAVPQLSSPTDGHNGGEGKVAGDEPLGGAARGEQVEVLVHCGEGLHAGGTHS